ncbi:hypothetical protein F383_39332 [Gossypium arboreum]|uniref:Uncharacterized protein n=1 Tax=Gossypium arboreum TaxID=29729 RepID=A0A0B0MMM7_GOSAR|nr:hypothetical protein F383_39332 [Gossypium arboreum]
MNLNLIHKKITHIDTQSITISKTNSSL